MPLHFEAQRYRLSLKGYEVSGTVVVGTLACHIREVLRRKCLSLGRLTPDTFDHSPFRKGRPPKLRNVRYPTRTLQTSASGDRLRRRFRRNGNRVADGIVAAVHINGDYLAVMSVLDLSLDVPLVYLIAAGDAGFCGQCGGLAWLLLSFGMPKVPSPLMRGRLGLG